MPSRAILITVVTVALALLAAGMWIRAISPMLSEVNASTQPASNHPGISLPSHPAPEASQPATAPHEPERPDKQFKGLIKAITWATFILITLLFALGFFVTLRAWMRSTPYRKTPKTRYVDAWKLAGERLDPKPDDDIPPSADPPKGS